MTPQAAQAEADAVVSMKGYLADSIEALDELGAVIYAARTDMALRRHVIELAEDPEIDEAIERAAKPFDDTVEVADLVARIKADR